MNNRANAQVYVVRASATGNIKVGCSSQIERRHDVLAKQHGTALEVLAVLPGGFPRELSIHHALARHRVPGMGREWFLPHPEVLAFVGSVTIEGRPPLVVPLRPKRPTHPHSGLTRDERRAIRVARYRRSITNDHCDCPRCAATLAARERVAAAGAP